MSSKPARPMRLLPALLLFASCSLTSLSARAAVEPPKLEASAATLGIPFERYTVKDSLGRTITFYLSMPSRSGSAGKKPVALLIQGSGCQSLFKRQGENISGGYQNILHRIADGRARVLAVEKPGVKFLDAPARPGSAEGAKEEFLREHTFERWAEANLAALRAAWTLPGIDAARTLVAGHSEGGIIAARVAAELPQVTHVASLAGGGPTQLFDQEEFRSQPRAGDAPGDSARRVREFFDEWAKVQGDPDSISKFWMGHPHRRWSSFLKHSVTEELLRTKARVFLAQGTADTSVSVRAHDVLVAELKARGRSVTAERIEGADHGFRTPEQPKGSPDGMKALFGRLVPWFLAEAAE
ncbi:MAG: alpha/beta fold hydrolase [Verrucomicrobia bacterium]|nr:alpha/beta fold hydrolase [Verrucomicrobiota bacterium]